MTSTVIRASMSDLVAVTFYRLGYRPRESLVFVAVAGPRRRVGVVVRADLPPPRLRRSVIGSQLRTVRRSGADEVVVLVVSDGEEPPGGTGPVLLTHRATVREVRRRASREGLHLMEALAVGPSRWRSYLCPDVSCCPPEGFPLGDALTGPAAARLVADGRVLAPDEDALVADVEPVPGQAPPVPDLGDRLTAGQAREVLARWRELLARPAAGAPPDPVDLARLAAALEDHRVRDAVLLTLVPGSGPAADAVVVGETGVADGVFTTEPDDDLLERGRVLLSAVARSAPPGRRAEALALLAWASWWSGHGVRGRLLARRALDDVPGHRLATLVGELLALGVAPEWIDGSQPPEDG